MKLPPQAQSLCLPREEEGTVPPPAPRTLSHSTGWHCGVREHFSTGPPAVRRLPVRTSAPGVLDRVWVMSQALARDATIVSLAPNPHLANLQAVSKAAHVVGVRQFGSQEPNKFFSVSFTSQKQWTPNSRSKREPATWPAIA